MDPNYISLYVQLQFSFLGYSYVVYLYKIIWIFLTLIQLFRSTVTVRCLTREASYKGAGL